MDTLTSVVGMESFRKLFKCLTDTVIMKEDSFLSVLFNLRRICDFKALYFFLLNFDIGLLKVHGKPVNIHEVIIAFLDVLPAIGKQKTALCL